MNLSSMILIRKRQAEDLEFIPFMDCLGTIFAILAA